MTCYRIAKWSDVFETSESRKYQTLRWVSFPTDSDSSGYQDLLEEFEGDRAAAMYGAWIALVKIASKMPTRGVLVSSRGKALSPARMSRMSGFSEGLFVDLIEWASSETVGWLEVTTPPSEPGDDRVLKPGEPGDDRETNTATAVATGPDRTLHNITRPDRTGPKANPTEPGDDRETEPVEESAGRPAVGSNEKFEEAIGVARSLSGRLGPRTKQNREYVWRAAWVSVVADLPPGCLEDSLTAIREERPANAFKFLFAAMRQRSGIEPRDFALLWDRAPPAPPPQRSPDREEVPA